MSHHLDTPLARQNGRLYIDDMYVFGREGATTFVMDVNSTITGPDITPGFHPEGRYEFKVHFDGADVEALTYRFAFDEPDADGRQSYTVYELTGAAANDDDAPGTPRRAGAHRRGGRAGIAARVGGTDRRPVLRRPRSAQRVNAAVRDGTPHDVLPYSVGTPASFGFAGINGRTLADNAPEAMFALVLARATPSGLGPATAADQRRDRFPYVVPA